MPDVTVMSIDDMEAIYGGLARRARAELGVTAWGMQVFTLPPDWDGYPNHNHSSDAFLEQHGGERRPSKVNGTPGRLEPGEEFTIRIQNGALAVDFGAERTTLGHGESLTTGGFVLRADGRIVVPSQTFDFVKAVVALGDLQGKTMAEIAAVIENCDPVPATDRDETYVHTWSYPGYELMVGFGRDDDRVRWSQEKLGGPATPALQARIEATTAGGGTARSNGAVAP